jgi:anti-sigma factor (TIGR02949 family)
MVSRLIGIFRRKQDADCQEVHDLSSDFIDEEMDDTSVTRMRSHLDKCPPCRAFVNSLKATVNLLRSTPKNEAPPDFRQRVRDNLPTKHAD